MFNLPANFTNDVISRMSGVIGELAPIMTLILGVLLGVVVIEIIIGALRK